MPGTRALLTALLATAATAVAAAPAQAAGQWVSGVGTYQSGYSCFGGTQTGYGNQTQTSAMFWSDPQAGYPAVGDKYYMQLHSGQIGFTCPWGIGDIETELILPSSTQLAIDLRSADKNDRVRCFYIDSKGKETEVTDFTWTSPSNSSVKGKWCDSTKVPSLGKYGYHLGYRLLSQGTQFVVRVPVMSTKRLAGMGAPGDTAKMAGAISSGVNTFTAPFQWVTVFDRAASIAYPATATTGIANTAATSNGVVNSWYRRGNIYVDLGTAASGTFTSTAGPSAVDGTYPQYTIKQDWGSLIPGTDYRWRVRFVDETGATTTGATQSFRTTGTAPTPGTGGGGNPTPGGGSTGGGNTGGGGSTPPVDEQPRNETPAPVADAPAPPAAAAASVMPSPAPRATAPVAAPPAKAAPAPVFGLGQGAKLEKRIPVTVTCATACTAKATLKVDAKTAKKLGLKSGVLGTGTKSGKGKLTITITPAKAIAKKLAKVKSVKASLTVTLSGGGTATTAVTLKK